MKGIFFTDYYEVIYRDFNDEYGKECFKRVNPNDYFSILSNCLINPNKHTFLEYNETTNKFTFIREDNNEYEFVIPEELMQQFINNENTGFDKNIRCCLELSKNKKKYFKMKNSGIFESPEDALLYINYLDYENIRGRIEDEYYKKAIDYILENATEDFDKYIGTFNNRIFNLKNDNEKVINDSDEFCKAMLKGTLINVILAILSLKLAFDVIGYFVYAVMLFSWISIICLVFFCDSKSDKKKNVLGNNTEISELEDIVKELKEKQLKMENTYSNKPLDERINEFKRELVNILFNDKFNILYDGNNEDYKKAAILLQEYGEEMNMFSEETLTIEKENQIKNKYLKKAKSLKQEILSRNYQQCVIDQELIQANNKEQGVSRALKPGI